MHSSSKAKLFESTFASNPSLDDQESQSPLYPISTITISSIKFFICKVRKIVLMPNTSISSSIPAIVIWSCVSELAPIFNKLSAFLQSWYIPFFMETCPLFPFPKQAKNLALQTIALSQSLISKTTETIVTKQLRVFLEIKNLRSGHQNGFRQLRSNGDILANAVAWFSALEPYVESRVISLDISKASDCTWHKDLLAKLSMFCLHHTLITWIASFISDRSITIRVDSFLSKPHSINSGAPQGSAISPK